MEIFFTLIAKLIPLYSMILLGYVARKFLKIKKELIAPILVYFIVPVIIFTGVVTTKLSISTLSIPLLFFFLCGFIALLVYYLSGFLWKNATKNILAFTAGSANTGYFGLPIAVALFGNSAVGIVALVLLGTSLYNNTLGFFLAAKGHHTTKESLLKVLRLPMLYAFFFGIIANLASIHLGQVYFALASYFNVLFTIFGMMLIGIGLADIKSYKFDFKFLGISLTAKFLLWPLLMLGIIFLDSHTLKIYDIMLYKLFMIMASVPIAANIVPYATILKIEPEKASLAVFISTIIALFYIPFIAFYLK